MKATILAVGTELTTGQITNSNASWLSAQLKALGLLTNLHLTVPDDRNLIRQALKLCVQQGELVFVTGGLGPTSDDFTRDLITEWAQQKLQFDESSWKKVVDRLTSRGFPVHDFQRQQCFFPERAQILDNAQGTANAFYLHAGSTHLWALPGPPREIEAVWKDHVVSQLQKLTQQLDLHKTQAWDLLGLGENQVAKIVEPLVEGSGLEVGYRVHVPYVEIKLSYFQSQAAAAATYLQAVEKAVEPYCVAKNGEDVAQMAGEFLLKAPRLVFEDTVTEGWLLKRLQTPLRSLMKRNGLVYSQMAHQEILPDDWRLSVRSDSPNSCILKLERPSESWLEAQLSSPWTSSLMQDRSKMLLTELILVELKRWSKKSSSEL
ncbi:MAG: competence/damage-inducible protein A [Bdellovibrionales bacterium]